MQKLLNSTIEKQEISPLTRTSVNCLKFDMPFFIMEGHVSKDKRWMKPVWPEDKYGESKKEYPLDKDFHYHGHYELIYVLDGVFTQHLENVTYSLNKGDATFLNNNICHYEGDETEFDCLYMNFSAEFLENVLCNNILNPSSYQHNCQRILEFYNEGKTKPVENRASLDFRKTGVQGCEVTSESIIKCEKIIENLICVLLSRESGYVFKAEVLLIKLFEMLDNPENYHLTYVYTNSSTEAILFSDIKHYIKERHGRISREELSSLLHYNPDYLGRVVKQHSGMNFVSYCQSFWIEKAKELLVTSDMSVDEIVHFLKFENKNNFYKKFMSAAGETPAEYRKKYKK